MEETPLTPRIVESADGSHTLRVDAIKEYYHSHNGAISESQHVFVDMGLKQFPEGATVRLLEVGLGTGLNALLTLLHQGNRTIHYTTLETLPLEWNLVRQLNYTSLIEAAEARGMFEAIHNAAWDSETELKPGFVMEKRQQALQDVAASTELFDVVYFDAFAPHAQPELWEPAIWKQLLNLMSDGGVLVTYCAKGQVRRDMKAAGFTVERLNGPPGKREMLRARK